MAEDANLSAANDSSQPSETSPRFLRQGIDVRVSNVTGYLCKIRLKAVLDMSPTEVFQIFINPQNSTVFRQIDKTIKHEVISEVDNTRTVSVAQESSVGALWFKRTFTTELKVVERKDKLETHFDLAKTGVMSAFGGHWKLSEYRAKGQDPDSKPQCLAYLEQNVAPAAAERMPGMFHGILRRVCANTCVGMIHDLQVCAALRQRDFTVDEILQQKIHGRDGLKNKVLGRLPWVPETRGLQRPSVSSPSKTEKGDDIKSFQIAEVDLEDDTK